MRSYWTTDLTIDKLLAEFTSSLKAPDFDDLDCCDPTIISHGIRDRDAFNKQAKKWTLKYASLDQLGE